MTYLKIQNYKFSNETFGELKNNNLTKTSYQIAKEKSRYLKWISFPLQFHHDRCIHTVQPEEW